jgi:hypothetical protein
MNKPFGLLSKNCAKGGHLTKSDKSLLLTLLCSTFFKYSGGIYFTLQKKRKIQQIQSISMHQIWVNKPCYHHPRQIFSWLTLVVLHEDFQVVPAYDYALAVP